MGLIIPVIIMFIFWYITYRISLKIYIRYNNTLYIKIVNSAINYRKEIIFDIITFLFLNIINVNVFTWIGIVYYFDISIVEFILILISIFAPKERSEGLVDEVKFSIDEFNHYINLLRISKILNEIISIFMIFELFSILK